MAARSPWRVAFAAGLVLLLGACEKDPWQKTPASPPLPSVAPAPVDTAGPSVPGADSSVPPAASVFPAASGAAGGSPSTVRSHRGMSPAQESTAMPMPGQNNDHSAPLPPARRASAP